MLEVREHGLRALFRQPLIRLVAAPIVGVTFDGDVKIGLRGEDAGNPRQLFSGGCGQAAAAMISSLER